MIKLVLISVFIVLFLLGGVFALGITPAIKKIDFMSGQEIRIPFTILDSSSDRLYDVSLRGGDFEKYSSLSDSIVKGGQSFLLIINFPNQLPEPGKHSISLSVKERPGEDSFINTVVEIGSMVEFFVPYPNLYGELSLNIPDSNVGDQIPVELHVFNRGLYELPLNSVRIDFFNNQAELFDNLEFTPATIPYSRDKYFRKYLDATSISSGIYLAKATINYNGESKEVNSSFRIGNLFINVTNYTNLLQTGGIHKFILHLKSNWNKPIYGIYADINISKNLNDSYSFRTPFLDLLPWQDSYVESYLDTKNLLGDYSLQINLVYPGNSSIFYGNLRIIEPSIYNTLTFIITVCVIVFLIIVSFIVWFILRKWKK